MQPPTPLPSNPPPVLAQLKQQTNDFLSTIVRANSTSQFGQAAPELNEFRRATANLIAGMDNDALADVFRKSVPFTSYDVYAPFVAKFFEKPCKALSVVHLLAPGLPNFLAHSSATSGAVPKYFPKYPRSSAMPAAAASGSWNISGTDRSRTALRLLYLGADQMDLEDEEHRAVKRIFICPGSNIISRKELNLSLEDDKDRMATFVLDHAVPHAAAFIKKWRSFLIVHGLFAVASRSLETVSMIFVTTFVDLIRYLDVEFDSVVDCIEKGTIPTLDGIEELRVHLEQAMTPDPERAAELRSLGRPSSRPGWCADVWPKLRSVTAVSSGAFASHIPLVRFYLGPNIDICPRNYASSDAAKIGTPYNPRELNLYKLTKINMIEFLDVTKSESVDSLLQVWEIEVGKQYEIVVTNPDGLWRYRLGDVIEIAGFDPTDGTPIAKFVERRNAVMTIDRIVFTEQELRASILSAPLVNIVDWTTTIDDRWLPRTVGFFVELASDEVPDLALTASDKVLDTLFKLKPHIFKRFETETLRKPTIRLVRPGTFSDFRQMKLDEGSKNVGQIKVPVVLPKAEYVTWFSDRVLREL